MGCDRQFLIPPKPLRGLHVWDGHGQKTLADWRCEKIPREKLPFDGVFFHGQGFPYTVDLIPQVYHIEIWMAINVFGRYTVVSVESVGWKRYNKIGKARIGIPVFVQ